MPTRKRRAESDRVKGRPAIKPTVAYRTGAGILFRGHAEDVLGSKLAHAYKGKVDLIFTSPPFPLNRKKKYDNLQGYDYVKWLSGFATLFKQFLKPTGSIVLEVGNSWEPGKPVMSTLALESLLAFLRAGKFYLCQQFVWNNPARLPSPAQWVTIERIRIKDSYTHLWWMSPCERPKADNRKILVKYSESMNKLLARNSYNAGRRPSQHRISEKSFLKNNGGAIAPSVLNFEHSGDTDDAGLSSVVTMANTQASTDYQRFCRDENIEQHPARMPMGLAEFFVRFLTDKDDVVLDPFAGSNTTGAAAERLNRRWLSIEPNPVYVAGSKGRFAGKIKSRRRRGRA